MAAVIFKSAMKEYRQQFHSGFSGEKGQWNISIL
jgi:hypothetical protein